MIRAPTDEEYRAYNGMHCSGLWRETPDTWTCPACDRTKRQIMRWKRRNGNNAAVYGPIGFTCALHRHHDHCVEAGYKPRFADVVICGACNQADAMAVRHTGATRWFSFSPTEIGQFVIPEFHAGHKLDYDIARLLMKAAVLDIITSR